MRPSSFLVVAVCAALVGCGDDDGPSPTDAGATTMDAGSRDGGGGVDAATGTDAGSAAIDAGARLDSGTPPGSDAGQPADSGTLPGTDAGPPRDAGPAASWAACSVTSDCTLEPRGCCPGCGAPELAIRDAVGRDGIAAHEMEVCPVPMPCPRCLTGVNPWLFATCGSGFCQGLDLRMTPLTDCAGDGDCRLRVRECCECGGDASAYSLIAIRPDAEGTFTSLVCDPSPACDACLPDYAGSGAMAFCNAGRCDVRRPP